MDKYTQAEKEHEGGQHNTYQEGCYECHKENRLIQAKRLIGRSETYNYPVNVSVREI